MNCRYHNLRPSEQMEVGFDADRDFMLVEIDARPTVFSDDFQDRTYH